MGLLANLRSRLRRRPVDLERALARAQADARRRAVREDLKTRGLIGGGDFGDGGL
jgi:hypothetical protein